MFKILFALTSKNNSFGQSLRFILVGSAAFFLVNVLYITLVLLGLAIIPSSMIAYISGTIFAFFLNRRFTFQSKSKASVFEFGKYAALYFVTLAFNTLVNWFLLKLIADIQYGFVIAFAISTMLSALVNFVGLKMLVFNHTVPSNK
ncbi:GtrA family protein [bacterium]|nr:GtrA family protein [bacterium]